MRVSSKADYGVRALFDLALRYQHGPTQSRDIAVRQVIPEAYLHQVLGALNRAGLVRSTRGPLGGHELARDPSEISIWDILVVLDGPERKSLPHQGDSQTSEVVHDVWRELQAQSVSYLSGMTLASLIERYHQRIPVANYSI